MVPSFWIILTLSEHVFNIVEMFYENRFQFSILIPTQHWYILGKDT